ncbi:hypothetical protein JHK82_048018 [Glycine max]|nr:hypothetical protein JHK82_048018 [Glycine max]
MTSVELPMSDWEDKWIDVYFDISSKLLDICNAFSSELSRLNQRNLPLKSSALGKWNLISSKGNKVAVGMLMVKILVNNLNGFKAVDASHNIPISPKIARQHDFGKILVESGFEKAIGSTLSAYTEAVRELACEILELIAEGLGVPDTRIFSRFIRDVDSDSVLRLNHYPPIINKDNNKDMSQQFTKVGFGEHSDPQIITILRSNEVGGLQISLQDGV